MNLSARLLIVATAITSVSAAGGSARQLTFEDRVRAQEAIERVYYSHQVGASLPFEESVPRAILERKVVTALRQSAALEQFWNAPVTALSLEAELTRMVKHTKSPERLGELFRALNDDPLLIQETLVRQTLVNRLTRNFEARDTRVQGGARDEAEGIRASLVSGNLCLEDEQPHRSEVTISSRQGSTRLTFDDGTGPLMESNVESGIRRVYVSPAEYAEMRASLPAVIGDIGSVEEDSKAYSIHAVLEEVGDEFRVVSWTVPKVSWEAWWSTIEHEFDETTAAVVASPSVQLPALGGAGLGGTIPSCVPDDTWVTSGSLDDSLEPRFSHTAIWTGTQMIVWGGLSLGAASNRGNRYDPATDTWTSVSPFNAPPPRWLHSAVWTGTQMIVWGGADNRGGVYSDGGRYDPVTDTWSPTPPTPLLQARFSHTAVWTGTQMIVWGGGTVTGIGLGNGARYEPLSNVWIPLTNLDAPSPRYAHTAVWSGSEMIVWGGATIQFNRVATGSRYDPTLDRWTPMTLVGNPGARDSHAAVWLQGTMIVWGGAKADSSAPAGARYNPATNTWLSIGGPFLPPENLFDSVVATNSQMFVFGSLGATASYDPLLNKWSPVSSMNRPFIRRSVSLWTGTQVIVWGEGILLPVNIGGRYTPATDSWTPVSDAGPVARNQHGAVWTGSQMIVWGGQGNPLTEPADGELYDLALDAWSRMSTTNGPGARVSPKAAWSGRYMVIWGGVRGGQPVATGARYDPLEDVWLPMSTVGAPTARRDAASVWTGKRMIVWGGTSGSTPLDSGGVYDPELDSWAPTSRTGAPTGRFGQSAVWTGTEMVVWGGSALNIYYKDGARYDPSLDRWRPTSIAPDTPSPRASHSAVWTGHEMIVWGGASFPPLIYYNSGSRYDPVSDTWRAMSLVGAPTARGLQSTVWTGRRMLLWGGNDGGTPATGGLYDPSADSWTGVSQTNVPRGRYYHSTVLANGLMLIWGGTSGSGSLRDGGVYAYGLEQDDDGDGFSECDGDCNDANPDVSPGTSEVCNGVDDNCDGQMDEDLGNITCGVGACQVTAPSCVGGIPQTCTPGAPSAEMCNGVDDDCDGSVDEGLGVGTVSVGLDPVRLWPPNHRMVDVHATVSLIGGCPSACAAPPAVILTSVASSEPDDAGGLGDGHTLNDIQDEVVGSEDFDFKLRAERDSQGNGRLYQMAYTVTDCFGDTATGVSGVFVPHDEGGTSEPLNMDVVGQPNGSTSSYALEWSPIDGATAYNVVRGRMSSIHAAGSFTVIENVECLGRGMTSTVLSGAAFEEAPPAGETFFYLVEYFDGQYSGYGTAPGGGEIVVNSGDACH